MSGFQNASVTKGIMILLGINSLVVAILGAKPYFHLQLIPHMTTYHQFWRILVHPFVFANSTELFLGELLLYNVGVQNERSFGPRKYSSFILVSSILSSLICLASIIVFNPLGINVVPAGPYGVIFSLLWQDYRTVPSMYAFRVMGVEVPSKIFTWVVASQLLLSSPPASIVASLAGLFTGYLYRTDTLFPLPLPLLRRRSRPLKSYRIPLSLYSLLSRLFSPIVGTSQPPRRSQRILPGQVDARAVATAVAGRAGGLGGGSASGSSGPTLRSLLSGRVAAAARAEVVRQRTPARSGGPGAASTARGTGGGADVLQGEETSTTGGARAAMGEWVNEMTGRGTGARAPTEDEIATLTSMFPNMGRDTIVQALQRNDYNTAQAVEALLES